MINLDHVRTFVAIIEARGFRGGARRLGIAEPTASQHIKKLEAALARRLIKRGRSGNSSEATAEGLWFLPFARALLKIEEQVSSRGAAVGASESAYAADP